MVGIPSTFDIPEVTCGAESTLGIVDLCKSVFKVLSKGALLVDNLKFNFMISYVLLEGEVLTLHSYD